MAKFLDKWKMEQDLDNPNLSTLHLRVCAEIHERVCDALSPLLPRVTHHHVHSAVPIMRGRPVRPPGHVAAPVRPAHNPPRALVAGPPCQLRMVEQ